MSDAIYMLNALWFKPEGGKQKYKEYGAAVAPLLERVGGEVMKNLKPEASLIGSWDPDLFFVVHYPSQSAFESMVTSESYQKIAHLREEAIDKSLLIRCKPFEWG